MRIQCETLQQDVKHHPSIPPMDMKKATDCLTETCYKDPKTLLYKVFMDVVYYMCLRGREGLRNLTKKSFVVKENRDGRRYITMTHLEVKKNSQGDGNHNSTGKNTIFEKDCSACPVKSMIYYMEKIKKNECDVFFQKLNIHFKTGKDRWFDNMCEGKNYLGDFMIKSLRNANFWRHLQTIA